VPDLDEDDIQLDASDRHKTAGRPGGSAFPRDANKEFRRYARHTAAGGIFGDDIARFSADEHITAAESIDRGRKAVSRFSRWR
jgi:hypothetical protein